MFLLHNLRLKGNFKLCYQRVVLPVLALDVLISSALITGQNASWKRQLERISERSLTNEFQPLNNEMFYCFPES